MVNQRRPRVRMSRTLRRDIDSCLINRKGKNPVEKMAIRNPFLLLLLLCQFYECTASAAAEKRAPLKMPAWEASKHSVTFIFACSLESGKDS